MEFSLSWLVPYFWEWLTQSLVNSMSVNKNILCSVSTWYYGLGHGSCRHACRSTVFVRLIRTMRRHAWPVSNMIMPNKESAPLLHPTDPHLYTKTWVHTAGAEVEKRARWLLASLSLKTTRIAVKRTLVSALVKNTSMHNTLNCCKPKQVAQRFLFLVYWWFANQITASIHLLYWTVLHMQACPGMEHYKCKSWPVEERGGGSNHAQAWYKTVMLGVKIPQADSPVINCDIT